MAAMWMWINEAYSALHKITNAFEVENLSPGSSRRYGWHGGKARAEVDDKRENVRLLPHGGRLTFKIQLSRFVTS